MGNINRHATAALIAAATLLAISWAAAAHATSAADNRDACHAAIDLANRITVKNGEVVGTMAARSASMRLGHWDDVDRLTPQLRDLQAEQIDLHGKFNDAAAAC